MRNKTLSASITKCISAFCKVLFPKMSIMKCFESIKLLGSTNNFFSSSTPGLAKMNYMGTIRKQLSATSVLLQFINDKSSFWLK